MNSKGVINFLFILALCMVVCINIFSFFQLSKLLTSNKWVIHTYAVIQSGNNISSSLLAVESSVRGYVITKDKSFINHINEKITLLLNRLKETEQLIIDNNQQKMRLSAIKPLLDKRINFLKRIINEKNYQTIITFVTEGERVTQQINKIINGISDAELILLQQRNIQSADDTQRLNSILLSANILSVLIFILSLIILNISFLKQKSILREKRRYENLLKGMIEGTNDIIVALDKNFRFIIFNSSFEHEYKQIFGKRPLLGTTLQESLSHLPNQLDKITALWQRALNGEEFNFIDEFGDSIYAKNVYECNFNSIYDEDGKIIGAASICRNIANRIEAEKSLQITHEKLEKAYQELKTHNLEILLFNEMENNLQSCNSIQETLDIIKLYCQKLLPFSSGILYLTNSSKNYLEAMSEWKGTFDIREKVFSPEQCWGLRQGKLYLYINQNLNIKCLHKQHDKKNTPYLCLPLLAQNEIIGMLHLKFIATENNSEDYVRKFINEKELLIKNLSTQVGLAIANIKLRENLKIRSIRDPLTGLYNRAYLNESLERDLQRANRTNTPMAIVIMDIDHFKRFNDVYGHDAGDVVLKEMGNILQMQIRSSDIACRYGGEEFVIVLSDADIMNSLERIEKLRVFISHMEVYFKGTLLENITASFGIANYPIDGEKMDILITAADQALYHSKRNGRNRVTVFSSSTILKQQSSNAEVSMQEVE